MNVLIICISTVLLITNFKTVLCENACPFGWQWNQQISFCVINCNSLTGAEIPNSNCQLPRFTNDVLYNATNDIFSMKAGNRLNIEHSYDFPNCYSVILTSTQYNWTSDGNYYQINYNIPFLFDFSVNKSDDLSISFCFPLSPQLLQCEIEKTPSGNYALVNATTLVIPEKNFSAYLGDFYIDEDGTAYTCPQSIIPTLYSPPRCHYIPLSTKEYTITDTGAMIIPKANFSIKNPLYSFIVDEITYACFPLTIEYLNCPIKFDWASYYFTIAPNLVALHETLSESYTPDSYYTYKADDLVLCLNDKDMYIEPIVTKIYNAYIGFNVVSALCLLTTIVFKADFYKTNYHTKCLLMHIICLIFMYLSNCLKKFVQTYEAISCYILYVFNYYSYMAAFFWLNVIAYDSFRNFGRLQTSPNYCQCSPCGSHPISNSRRFLYFNIYAWGMPLLLMTITLIIDLVPMPRDNMALNPEIEAYCWFNNNETTAIYFYGPLGALMFSNLIFFILTVHIIHRAGSGTDVVNHSRRRQIFEVAVKLFVLMGLVWMVDVICFLLTKFDTDTFKYWYISRGLTSIQGIVIFIIYFANKNVVNAICRTKCTCRFPLIIPIQGDSIQNQQLVNYNLKRDDTITYNHSSATNSGSLSTENL